MGMREVMVVMRGLRVGMQGIGECGNADNVGNGAGMQRIRVGM